MRTCRRGNDQAMKAKCREYVPVIKWHVTSAFDIEPIEPNIGIDRWYKTVIFE